MNCVLQFPVLWRSAKHVSLRVDPTVGIFGDCCLRRSSEVGATTCALRSKFSGVSFAEETIGVSDGKLLIGGEPDCHLRLGLSAGITVSSCSTTPLHGFVILGARMECASTVATLQRVKRSCHTAILSASGCRTDLPRPIRSQPTRGRQRRTIFVKAREVFAGPNR
jgi:hypothetical protein